MVDGGIASAFLLTIAAHGLTDITLHKVRIASQNRKNSSLSNHDVESALRRTYDAALHRIADEYKRQYPRSDQKTAKAVFRTLRKNQLDALFDRDSVGKELDQKLANLPDKSWRDVTEDAITGLLTARVLVLAAAAQPDLKALLEASFGPAFLDAFRNLVVIGNKRFFALIVADMLNSIDNAIEEHEVAESERHALLKRDTETIMEAQKEQATRGDLDTICNKLSAIEDQIGDQFAQLHGYVSLHDDDRCFAVYECRRREIRIGREQQPTGISIPSDPEISSDHALVTFCDDGYFLKDHSKNGTVVEGQRLCHKQQRFAFTVPFRIGNVSFRVTPSSDPRPKPSPTLPKALDVE